MLSGRAWRCLLTLCLRRLPLLSAAPPVARRRLQGRRLRQAYSRLTRDDARNRGRVLDRQSSAKRAYLQSCRTGTYIK